MKKVLILFSVPFILTFVSCSNQPASTENQGPDTTLMFQDTLSEATKEMVDFKFFYTIANLPSPMEVISEIYKNEVPFNKDLLNPVTNEAKYNSAYKKAVNYGVYGIDMAYAAFYGQNQDLLNYYSTTKKVAGRLKIEETFDQFTSSFRSNSDNKDSLVKMIDRAYAETDTYLKNNSRLMDATHILGGAILEAQHLSVELMKNRQINAANASIFEKIYNQKLYVDNMISLLEELKGNPETASLLEGFKGIQQAYSGINSTKDMNSANLALLSAAIGKARAEIIR